MLFIYTYDMLVARTILSYSFIILLCYRFYVNGKFKPVVRKNNNIFVQFVERNGAGKWKTV